jgi:hypothetical protein
MNHHNGQTAAGAPAMEYMGMVLNITLVAEGINAALTKEFAYMASHWASTRAILVWQGIPNIKIGRIAGLGTKRVQKVTFSDDVKVRLAAMPAETHKHVVALAAANKLARTRLVRFFGDVSTLVAVKSTVSEIVKDPARYYIGALYLTGQERAAFSDSDAGNVLGRLGCFVRALLGKSTLAKSSHFEAGKLASYDDYSPDWANLCNQFALAKIGVGNIEAAMKEMEAALSAKGQQELIATLTGNFN